MKPTIDLKIPLRQRKKEKLRGALLTTSFRLFREKGYARTTLEEIAEKCDVTVQTLLRYFGSKEDLLFANQGLIRQRFEEGLPGAIRKGRVLDYWADFLRENARRLLDTREVRETYSIIAGAPSLVSRLFAIAQQYQILLEQALSEEIGLKAGQDIHSTLLAYLVAIGPMEPMTRALAKGSPKMALRVCDEVIEYARDNFKRPAQNMRKKAGAGPRVPGRKVSRDRQR